MNSHSIPLSYQHVVWTPEQTGQGIRTKPATRSALSILRAMINHAENMSEVVLEAGRTWPLLTGAEMRDIFAYVRKSAESGKRTMRE